MQQKTIKILIVDDSKVSRELMIHLLMINPELEVLGTATDGVEALKFIEQTPPDIVITDIVMPNMDGFELTKKIMEQYPTPVIVVSGVYNREEIKKSFEAIDAGAIAILEKPQGFNDEQFSKATKFIIETFTIMSQILHKSFLKPSHLLTKDKSQTESIQAVGIGSSLNGSQSLRKILRVIPQTTSTSFFLVQHIFPGFIQGFIDWIAGCTKLKVQIAKNGDKIAPANIYVIPNNMVMEVLPGGFLSVYPDATPSETKTETVGSLFRSLGNIYGSRSLGILLYGFGSESIKSLNYMKEKGALTIAETYITQDNQSQPQDENITTSIDDITRFLQQAILDK